LRAGDVELLAIFWRSHVVRCFEVARQGLHVFATDHAESFVFTKSLIARHRRSLLLDNGFRDNLTSLQAADVDLIMDLYGK
jgi:hypothetical protein